MNYKLQITNYKLRQKGFSLFIAVIVMGALLLIAFSVANISVKETEFSNSNKESQLAYFAADSGIECALYWDSKYNGNSSVFSDPAPGTISCNNNSISSGTGQAIPGTSTVTTLGINNWSFCADEDGVCSFAGTKQVRYGANSSYYYQTATNSINCDNFTFGDPIPGTRKHCDYAISSASIFGFNLNSAANATNACVAVIVNKNTDGTTKINSYGYNNCNTADPRRVERGIEVTY